MAGTKSVRREQRMVVYKDKHGDEMSAVGERAANRPESEKCSSLRVNIVRWGTVVIIILFMFTPVIIQTIPFPWTTKKNVYTGAVCTQDLLYYQNTSTKNLSFLSLTDLGITGREKEVLWTVGKLNSVNASRDCVEGLRLWMCVILFTSEHSCVTTPNNGTNDWLMASVFTCPENTVHSMLETSVYLEECLPEPANGSSANIMDVDVSFGVECKEDFFFDNSSKRCVPECGKWTYTTHREDRILTGFIITGTVLGVFIAISFFIGSVIKHKQMFRFPAVFLVYATVNLFIYLCLTFPIKVDRETVICSSSSLVQTLESGPSFYCLFMGALSVYGKVQVVFWWFCHTSVLTYGVFWPIKYQRARNLGRLRYLHIILLVLGIILPVIPTMISWLIGDYGVDVVRNCWCLPRDNLTLESIPTAVFGSVTLVMFMLIASKIYLVRQRSMAKGDVYLAEIKALIVLSTSFFAFIVLAGTDSVLLWGADSIHADVEDLFHCEARGLIPGLDCSRDCLNSAYSILDTVGATVRAILPAFFLIFLVDLKSVKSCLLGRRQRALQTSTRLTLSQTTII